MAQKKRKRNPDPHCKKIYELERTILDGVTFRRIKEVQFYVNQITGSVEWQTAEPSPYRVQLPRVVSVELHEGKVWSAAFHPNKIVLAKRHLIQSVVLHELAHLMTPDELPDHGKEFSANYLWLARMFWGVSYTDALARMFARYRIPVWTPPARRPLDL